MISSFQNLLYPSIATIWPVTVTVTMSCVIWQCDSVIMLCYTLTPVSRIETKINKNKNKIQERLKETWVQTL